MYFALFATGYWIYDYTPTATVLSVLALIGAGLLFKLWGKLKMDVHGTDDEVVPESV